jgi:glycine betaine/proline transport system substrate-binding protein
MRKSKFITGALMGIMLGVVGVANAADSTKPIVIPTHNWSSQVVMAYVIGGIFESMGNNVEYVPADSQAVYEAIRNGDVTISHEVWQSSFGKSFYNAMAKGGVIDAGTHAALTLEEMGVPTWVIDKNLCPGLPNWEALKKCKDVFATPDSGGKGRWLEGPQSWHGDLMPDRVAALGLGDSYVVKFAGGADALWAELAAAKKEGRGTITFNWTPNFTDAEGFTFIEFPAYTEGCRKADGGDGSCGSPKGWLKKAANYKFPKTHPAAYTAFSRMSFTTQDIGQMAALVDIDKLTHEDAAKKWLADHADVWKPFTQAGM